MQSVCQSLQQQGDHLPGSLPYLMPLMWRTSFLCQTVRVFLDEIKIQMGKLSKADFLPQCEWASSNPMEAQVEQKRRVKENVLFCLFLSRDIGLLILGFTLSALLVLRPLDLDGTTPPALLALCPVSGRLWDFLGSQSCKPIPHSTSLFFIQLFHQFCFLRTQTAVVVVGLGVGK